MLQSSPFSTEKIEIFINDCLKEDLRQLEIYINKYNEEIMEFIQLKNTIQTMRDHLNDGFKTQVNIGANMFIQAKVKDTSTILVDIGKGYYLPFSQEEALKFIDFKIRQLTKDNDVLREESIKKRSEIKLMLTYLAEKNENSTKDGKTEK